MVHDDVIKWKHFPRNWPSQRPVTLSFDVFFHLCLNKQFSKQSWGWWFETLSHSLWCHCNTSCQIFEMPWCSCDVTVMKILAEKSCCLLIGLWTQWLKFHRQHFKKHKKQQTYGILIKSLLKYVPKDPINNNIHSDKAIISINDNHAY